MVASGEILELSQVQGWLDTVSRHHGEKAAARIKAAFELADQLHQGEQLGDLSRILFLLRTAAIVDGLKLDADSVVATLLAESPGNPGFDPEAVERQFGKPVLKMIQALFRIAQFAVTSRADQDQHQLENLRRMLLGLADDVRVLVIVLARRLQKLRLLPKFDSHTQQDVGAETLRIHAPLANRLGIWQLKWELEDLAFRFTDNKTYKELARSLEAKRNEREVFINEFMERLSAMCKADGVDAHVSGRPKHIYSIWKKMQRKHVSFAEIYDVRAVRVEVESVANCYQVLGMVHGTWRPVPGEFDDYIARPKANGYRSLHTAVIGDDGLSIEVQIRTAEMHEHAERGVAAHWRYKESRGEDQELERRVAWMRSWLENSSESVEPDAEFEAKTIYVLTPMGKVVELPKGATAIDFAYAIHSAVGHRCRGAKADGKIIPLTRALSSGQTIEVLTVKQGGPSRDWLSPHTHYVVTSRARGHIRQWFKKQDHDQHVTWGRAALDRELNKLGLGHVSLESLTSKFNYKHLDDLLAAIGRGDVSPLQVAHTQVPVVERDADQEIPEKAKKRHKKRRVKKGAQVTVAGVGDLMTQTAKCCKPVPYDPIVGYITRGRGVTIHRQNCKLVSRMTKEQQQRLIPIAWADQPLDGVFLADIQVHAWDRKDLLRDITSVFSNEDVAVLGVNTQSDRKKERANMLFSVEITNMDQLARVLEKLEQVPDVYSVERQS